MKQGELTDDVQTRNSCKHTVGTIYTNARITKQIDGIREALHKCHVDDMLLDLKGGDLKEHIRKCKLLRHNR